MVTLKTVQLLVNYRCRISPFTMARVMQRLRRTMGYLLKGGMTAFPVDDQAMINRNIIEHRMIGRDLSIEVGVP